MAVYATENDDLEHAVHTCTLKQRTVSITAIHVPRNLSCDPLDTLIHRECMDIAHNLGF